MKGYRSHPKNLNVGSVFEAGVGKTQAVHPAWVCFCLEGSAKEAGVSEAEAAVTGGPTRRNAANQTSVLLTKQQALFIDIALCH